MPTSWQVNKMAAESCLKTQDADNEPSKASRGLPVLRAGSVAASRASSSFHRRRARRAPGALPSRSACAHRYSATLPRTIFGCKHRSRPRGSTNELFPWTHGVLQWKSTFFCSDVMRTVLWVTIGRISKMTKAKMTRNSALYHSAKVSPSNIFVPIVFVSTYFLTLKFSDFLRP